MATADQVKALVKSHAEGDDTKFYSIALQVAARAARSGQNHFATELRDLIDAMRTSPTSKLVRPVPVTQPKGELAGLMSVSYPTDRLPDLVLDKSVAVQLKRLLLEQRQKQRLIAGGFRPSRKLLLVGAPGTGKTMSSSVIAGELNLPIFTVRLDGLISRYMGETAAKLRLIFEALQQVNGVYLFDEVDALAGERGRSNDVGEIRRVLNSFLQFLEQDDSESLVIAATNHPQLLDRAMFRRFDEIIEYPLPDGGVIRALVENRLGRLLPQRVAWKTIETEAAGLSHAEIVLAVEGAAKVALLGESTVTSKTLIEAFRDRRKLSNPK